MTPEQMAAAQAAQGSQGAGPDVSQIPGEGPYDAIIQNILQEMAQLPPEVQTGFLGLLNQEYQAVQTEQNNSPQAADQRASDMAALVA